MVECPARKLAGVFMRKSNSCDGSPTIAVCAAIGGVIGFLTRESYVAYCNHIADDVGRDYLVLCWIGGASLIVVALYAIQHGIRFGF